MTIKRPSKIPNILVVIRKAVEIGNFVDVVHAEDRKQERNITRPEYLYVLNHGYHEPKKDEYKEEFKAWNYAIRGKTIDDRELRVVVSFDENNMLIITVIDLEKL